LQKKLKEESVLHELGQTRSSLKADHLLQTPDTFIRTPLPGIAGVQFIVHAGLRLGANFTMMTAEFEPEGILADPPDHTQRFVYVLEGELEAEWEESGEAVQENDIDDVLASGEEDLTAGSYVYLPANARHTIRAKTAARAVIIEKEWELPHVDVEQPLVQWGKTDGISAQALGEDESLRVQHLMPDEQAYDFAVNIMTYDPGAALSQVEVHVMEHGLLMLEGGGIYRLGDHWYPVTAGDFIWMAPYCPQWFGALGKTPAKYLIYKDWYRHPLGGL
jgi:(S)-ureidoglycine aminohydrolase